MCDAFVAPGLAPTANQIKASYGASFDTRLLLVCNFLPVNAVFIRTRADEPTLFDEQLGLLEDWELWLRLHIHRGYRFSAVPVTTTVYHRVPGFGSMTSRTGEIARFRDTFRRIVERYPSNDPLVQRGRALHEQFYDTIAPVSRESAFSYEQFVARMDATIRGYSL